MNARAKIWVEKEGKPVFGDGRYALLKAISSEGSINKGARKLGMAYKQAWDEINLMEKRFGMKLLRRRKGGVRGGGAELTEHALSLLGRYERFRDKATVAINAAFRDVFE